MTDELAEAIEYFEPKGKIAKCIEGIDDNARHSNTLLEAAKKYQQIEGLLREMMHPQYKVCKGMWSDDKEIYGGYREKRGWNEALKTLTTKLSEIVKEQGSLTACTSEDEQIREG